jgi:hypothetical protein
LDPLKCDCAERRRLSDTKAWQNERHKGEYYDQLPGHRLKLYRAYGFAH